MLESWLTDASQITSTIIAGYNNGVIGKYSVCFSVTFEKSKGENAKTCTFTYKTRPSAEFGPPSLFTICSCRRDLAHRCMCNRQHQGCTDGTFKNDRYAAILRYLINPEEKTEGIWNSPFFSCLREERQ